MDIKQLQFSYGNKVFIDALSTSIERGKITTIIGPNGSGKSTLLNLLIRQLQPKGGEILFNGQNIKHFKPKEMAKNIGIVHQHHAVIEEMTVRHLVEFGRSPYKTFLGGSDKDEEIVDWALEVTGLKELREKTLGALSGGERQRAWIAMALAQKTELLFLDEPTTYLDIYYQLEILNLVKKLNIEYKMTIVMVLHDINQALQFSDNVMIMKKGKLIYSGESRGAITEERLKEVYGINTEVHWCEKNQAHYIVPLV